MSSRASERSGSSTERASASGGLKLLFFLSSITHGAALESVLDALLARGHEIHVALEHHKGRLHPRETRLFDALRQRHSGLRYEELPARKDLWLIPASAIRRRLDYLRSLEPGRTDATPFPGGRPPLGLRILLFLPPFRWQFGRRLLASILRRLEAAMPIPRSVKSYIGTHAPDVVLVSPLVDFDSAQGDYLRVAESAKIPSVVLVAREHDLTTKGGIRDVPTLVLARNDAQVEQAVRLHGLPPDRILAAGVSPNSGLDPAAAEIAVSAIERAAGTEVVPTNRGRFLRPLLWLLTPLLAIALPLLRPRATARAAIKALRRAPRRIRKRMKMLRRARSERLAKRRALRAERAKEKKLAAAEEKRKVRAEEREEKRRAAEAERRRVQAAKREEKRRAAEAESGKTRAAEQEEKARIQALKQEKARERAAKAEAKARHRAAKLEKARARAAKAEVKAQSDGEPEHGEARPADEVEQRTSSGPQPPAL